MKGYLDYVRAILEQNEYVLEDAFIGLSKEEVLQNETLKEDLQTVYEDMGGVQALPPLKPRQPDFVTNGNWVVVDTELDYNRYRIQTLRAEFYDETTFPVSTWRQKAKELEKECLKTATQTKLWTSPQSEHYFGKSEAPGDLGLNGSALWKVRAYKNMLLDLSSMRSKIPLVRISIFDKVMIAGKLCLLKDLLMTRQEDQTKYLLRYLERNLAVKIEE